MKLIKHSFMFSQTTYFVVQVRFGGVFGEVEYQDDGFFVNGFTKGIWK